MALVLRAGGASDVQADQLGLLLDLCEPVDVAYRQASRAHLTGAPPPGNRAQIVDLRSKLDAAFSPDRHVGAIFSDTPDWASTPTATQVALAEEASAHLAGSVPGCAEDIDSLRQKTIDWMPSFSKIATEMEKDVHPSRRSPRNAEGVPTIFWSGASSTFHLASIAVCIYLRCTLQCDASNSEGIGPRSSTSPAALLLLWLRHYLRHGRRDVATGLLMDFSMRTNASRAPTLMAHSTHGSRFHTGWANPYPTDLAQFDSRPVNGRVELCLINFAVGSWRKSALDQCLRSIVPALRVMLGRLRAHGALLLDLKLTPSFPAIYQWSGVSNSEREGLNSSHGLALDLHFASANLALTMELINMLLVRLDDHTSGWAGFDFDSLASAIQPDASDAINEAIEACVADCEDQLDWLTDPAIRSAVRETVITASAQLDGFDRVDPSTKHLEVLRRLPRRMWERIDHWHKTPAERVARYKEGNNLKKRKRESREPP